MEARLAALCRGCAGPLPHAPRAAPRLLAAFLCCTRQHQARLECQLPKSFCPTCTEKINSSYEFIQSARQATRSLIHMINYQSRKQSTNVQLSKQESNPESGTTTIEIKYEEILENEDEIEVNYLEAETKEECFQIETLPDEGEVEFRDKNQLNNSGALDAGEAKFKCESIYKEDECYTDEDNHAAHYEFLAEPNEEKVKLDSELLSNNFGYQSLENKFQSSKKNKTKKLKTNKAVKSSKDRKRKKKADLKTNIKSHDRSTECPQCKKKFTSRLWFDKHMAKAHECKKHACKLCPKVFSRSDILQQHMVCHSKERPFPCHLCHRAFKLRKLLNYHLRTHDAQFTCDICNANFKMRNVLMIHMKVHTAEKPHLCHLCGYRSNQACNLVDHMRTHTGEKPFSCTRCPFTCASQSSMKRHEQTHDGPLRRDGTPRHVCQHCKKHFHSAGTLKRHTRIHTGELPYRCEFCGRAFIDSWKRKNHMSKCHHVERTSLFTDAHKAARVQTDKMVVVTTVENGSDFRSEMNTTNT